MVFVRQSDETVFEELIGHIPKREGFTFAPGNRFIMLISWIENMPTSSPNSMLRSFIDYSEPLLERHAG